MRPTYFISLIQYTTTFLKTSILSYASIGVNAGLNAIRHRVDKFFDIRVVSFPFLPPNTITAALRKLRKRRFITKKDTSPLLSPVFVVLAPLKAQLPVCFGQERFSARNAGIQANLLEIPSNGGLGNLLVSMRNEQSVHLAVDFPCPPSQDPEAACAWGCPGEVAPRARFWLCRASFLEKFDDVSNGRLATAD